MCLDTDSREAIAVLRERIGHLSGPHRAVSTSGYELMKTRPHRLFNRLWSAALSRPLAATLILCIAIMGCQLTPGGQGNDDELLIGETIALLTLKETLLLAGGALLVGGSAGWFGDQRAEEYRKKRAELSRQIEAVTLPLLPITTFIEATQALLKSTDNPVEEGNVSADYWNAVAKLYATDRFRNLREMESRIVAAELALADRNPRAALYALSNSELTKGELDSLEFTAVREVFFYVLAARAETEKAAGTTDWGWVAPTLAVSELRAQYANLDPWEAAANVIVASGGKPSAAKIIRFPDHLERERRRDSRKEPETSTGTDGNGGLRWPPTCLSIYEDNISDIEALMRAFLHSELGLSKTHSGAIPEAARYSKLVIRFMTVINMSNAREALKTHFRTEALPIADNARRTALMELFKRLVAGEMLEDSERRFYSPYLRVFLYLECLLRRLPAKP